MPHTTLIPAAELTRGMAVTGKRGKTSFPAIFPIALLLAQYLSASGDSARPNNPQDHGSYLINTSSVD